MEYTFLYELDKFPQNKRKSILPILTDSQLKLLYYIYIFKNKNNIKDQQLREAIIKQEFNSTEAKSLDELVSFIIETAEISDETITDAVITEILSYIAAVELYAGPIEAKKAAKVIFCKKRVVGIKSKDILKEMKKRKNKKKYEKVKKTC